MIKHISKVTKWLYIQSYICKVIYTQSYTYKVLYIQSYIPKLYIQRIIQKFNLSVGSHVIRTLKLAAEGFEKGYEEGGMDALSPPPILLYITIWLYILIYTILLCILFFKTINFFPKFNFLASYSSSFLKNNLPIFWA